MSESSTPDSAGPYADHPEIGELPLDARQEIADLIAKGKTIAAIKTLREAMGGPGSCGLADAKRIVESLPRYDADDSAHTGTPRAALLATGQIDGTTTLNLYRDGTFTTKGLFLTSAPDVLVDLSFDSDSMRRKSATGRGAAAAATGGLSLLAANNRGVLYVTVTGKSRGSRTYTTKNPSDRLLKTARTLQSAAQSVLAEHNTPTPAAATPVTGGDVATQLKTLAELHASGALTDDEFTAAKAQLLNP